MLFSLKKRRIASRASQRRGISLMEVLISIFVTAVGLLGLVSLIPAGQVMMQRANIADHGSALGRKALRELRVRGLLEPNHWFDPIANKPVAGFTPFDKSVLDALRSNPGFPGVMLDPFIIAPAHTGNGPVTPPNNPPRNAPTVFPFYLSSAVNTPIRLRRLTLADNVGREVRKEYALELFTLHDDLSVVPREDVVANAKKTDDSAQKFERDGLRAVDRRFSYVVTIVRDPGYQSAATPLSLSVDPFRFIVSVAVIHSRLEIPKLGDGTVQEIGLIADTSTMGLGGGKVTLKTDNDPSAIKSIEKLRAGHWIMLSRQGALTSLPPPNNIGATWARWYRIVEATDADATAASGQRMLTVQGPDWPPPFKPDPAVRDQALILADVHGVYEEVMELPQRWRYEQ